jgi:3-dehydroquinate dehydratase-2
MMRVGDPCVLVIHGPNLNLLGKREPGIYGKLTLDEINCKLQDTAKRLGISVKFTQSNHEGIIVDAIQEADWQCSGIIINAAAFSHYSIAIRDALAAISIPAIEVHISNIYKREEFRHHSVISSVVHGQISGFGPNSYQLALEGIARIISGEN